MAAQLDHLRAIAARNSVTAPVRFDDCPVPDLEIGGGRTLASIQRADLFGEHRDEATIRLLATVQRLLAQHPPQSLNSTIMRLLTQQDIENADYDKIYATVLEQIMAALWSVDTEDSESVFIAQGIQLIRTIALKAREFYIGEFLNIFKDAVVRQGRDEAAACELELNDAHLEVDSANVELQARFTTARVAGDREAEHAVWQEREARQAACQARVDAATRRIGSVALRIEACEKLASQLGFGYS